MANTATVIIITAGSITFVNEWYQTRKINWRVPVATMIVGAIFDGLSRIDDKAATGLAVIAFLAAVTTEFNGKSMADTLAGLFPAPAQGQSLFPKTKAK